MALGRENSGPPPDLSYFPGYNYWPPESLVFDPPFLNFDSHAEDVKPLLGMPPDSNTSRASVASTATSTNANTTPVSVPGQTFSEVPEELSNALNGHGGLVHQQHGEPSVSQQRIPWNYNNQTVG